jgi:hypothetical protein
VLSGETGFIQHSGLYPSDPTRNIYLYKYTRDSRRCGMTISASLSRHALIVSSALSFPFLRAG